MSKVTTIRLDDEQAEQLEAIAQVEGRSVSEAVREAVSLLVDQKRSDGGFRHQAGRLLERRTQALVALTRPPDPSR